MATDNDGVQTPVDTPVDDVNDTDIDTFSEEFFAKPAKVEAKPAEKEEKSTDAPADGVATEDEPEPEAEAADPVNEDEPNAEDTAEDDEPEDEFKPKHKNRKTAQERISELTAKVRDAERRAEEAERRAYERNAERQNPTPERPAQQPVRQTAANDPGAPDPNALDANGNPVYPLGEFDPLYVVENTRYAVRKEMEEARAQDEQKQAQRAEENHMAQLQVVWQDRLTKAEADFDDLRPTIASLESQLRDVPPELGTYLAETIMQMDVGPQVLYYLANHPDEANAIVAAGPVGATLKLGKLEAKVEAALEKRRTKGQTQAAPVRQTKAPEPPQTTRGRGTLPTVAPDTDDLDAFETVFYKKKK